MFGRFFLDNGKAKIRAICGGLALCSLSLLLAKCAGLESFISGIVFDDMFFGSRWQHASGYYLMDAILMGGVALLLPHRPRLATKVGLAWTGFVLVESICDLPVFARDRHMLLEEFAFVMIYSVLFVMLAGFWMQMSHGAD